MSEQPDQPAPDGVLGELTVSELRSLETLRKNEEVMIREIGLLEVRKTRFLGTIRELDTRAQGVLQEAAKRLQIPPGEVWHVTQDGKVVRGPGAG